MTKFIDESSGSLLIYKESLDKAVREACTPGSDKKMGPFFNRSANHAMFLLKAVFETADKGICIIASILDDDVYGNTELANSAKFFLKKLKGKNLSSKETPLRILLDGFDDEKSCSNNLNARSSLSFVKQLKIQENNFINLVAIRCVPTEVSKKYEYNFALSDTGSYRFEPDKSKMNAVGYFGKTGDADKLQQRFEEIWSLSKVCDTK